MANKAVMRADVVGCGGPGDLAIQYPRATGHYPVDRLLPQSNLQRMKLLFEGDDGLEANASAAGVSTALTMADTAGTLFSLLVSEGRTKVYDFVKVLQASRTHKPSPIFGTPILDAIRP